MYRQSPGTESPLVLEIRSFLEEASKRSVDSQFCAACGMKMKIEFVTFSFSRTGEVWEVPLAVCNCGGFREDVQEVRRSKQSWRHEQ